MIIVEDSEELIAFKEGQEAGEDLQQYLLELLQSQKSKEGPLKAQSQLNNGQLGA